MNTHTTQDVMTNIIIEVTVPKETVIDVITTGIEQGIGYWATDVDKGSLGEIPMIEKPYTPYYGNFEHPNWELKITEEGGEIHTLTKEKVAKGFSALHPTRLANLLSGDYDCIDADCFIQCALFGSVIYG